MQHRRYHLHYIIVLTLLGFLEGLNVDGGEDGGEVGGYRWKEKNRKYDLSFSH